MSAHSDWAGWPRFFLEVHEQARAAIDHAEQVITLRRDWQARLAIQKASPTATLSDLVREVSAVSARAGELAPGPRRRQSAYNAIQVLEDASILREITGRARGRASGSRNSSSTSWRRSRSDAYHPDMIRWLLIGLHAVLGIAAVGAGLAFVRDPSGGALGMTEDWLHGSPFADFRFPGLFLAVVLGGTNLASAAALLRRHPFASWLSLATGALLVLWVAIQTAIIGFRHWSQAIWWVAFSLVTVLAALLLRGERRAGCDS